MEELRDLRSRVAAALAMQNPGMARVSFDMQYRHRGGMSHAITPLREERRTQGGVRGEKKENQIKAGRREREKERETPREMGGQGKRER